MAANQIIRYLSIAAFFAASWTLLAGSMNLSFDMSPATTDRVINTPGLMALTVMASIFFAYSKRANFAESIFCITVGIAACCLEFLVQTGSFEVRDTNYQAVSIEQKKQDAKLELQKEKLAGLKNVSIDKSTLLDKKAELESQLSAKKEAAKANCQSTWHKCKDKELTGSGEIEAKINAINQKMQLADNKLVEIDKTDKALSNDNQTDWKKLHPFYKATSKKIYDTQEKADDAKNWIQSAQAALLVIMSAFGLRIAFADDSTFDKVKGIFKSGVNGILSKVPRYGGNKSAATGTTASAEPSISFLRTGTGNEPFEVATNEPKRGYGEVVNFPQRNNATATSPNDNRLTDNVVQVASPNDKAIQSTALATQALAENNDNRYELKPNDNRLTDNVVKVAENNDKAKGKPLVSGNGKLKTAVCEFSPCSKEFERTVSWKRFCCEKCKIKAWEQKHGKTFRKRRAAK